MILSSICIDPYLMSHVNADAMWHNIFVISLAVSCLERSNFTNQAFCLIGHIIKHDFQNRIYLTKMFYQLISFKMIVGISVLVSI